MTTGTPINPAFIAMDASQIVVGRHTIDLDPVDEFMTAATTAQNLLRHVSANLAGAMAFTGLTKKALASQLHISETRMGELISGRDLPESKRLTIEEAMRLYAALSAVLGVTSPAPKGTGKPVREQEVTA